MYDDKNLPSPTTDASRTHDFGISGVISANQMVGKASTNITGQFPITSTWGNAYVFVVYEYDPNAIMASPIKDRTK